MIAERVSVPLELRRKAQDLAVLSARVDAIINREWATTAKFGAVSELLNALAALALETQLLHGKLQFQK